MNLKEKIKSLLQQGSLYRTQGLLNEAMGKYEEALKLVENAKQVKNRDTIIQGIKGKMKSLDDQINVVEEAPMTPEVDPRIQDLIKQQFAFSEDEDKGALEGAIALAKFGQFNRALQEFQELLERESIRVDAAKNVIRCHMALESFKEAIDEYGQWVSNDVFNPAQLNRVRVFFEATLEKSGIEETLPDGKPKAEENADIGTPTIEMPDIQLEEPGAPTIDLPGIELPDMDDDEMVDINSISFEVKSGPLKDQMIEVNVSFQSEDTISVLVPARDRDIIDYLNADVKLEDAQFYSPMAIFSGTGKVITKTKIESGPRRGDYSLDIKVIIS